VKAYRIFALLRAQIELYPLWHEQMSDVIRVLYMG